jgi:glycosyltransferase involved in cell wall biosynthesis
MGSKTTCRASVVLCCYNSKERLEPTLRHLQQQDFEEEWEVLLVDNASTDNTVTFALSLWDSPAPLRVVKETKPGLSNARDSGRRNAKGEYIIFCDDDNWLYSNYVRVAVDFMESHPEYAAIGGWGEAVVSPGVEIPEWFSSFQTKYACGKTRPKEGNVDSLIGAGICLRKSALNDLYGAGFRSILSDRKGNQLSSGGDIELTMALRLRNWKLYYSEDLRFCHYMEPNRLTEEYLLQMCLGHSLSSPVFMIYKTALNNKGSNVKIYIAVAARCLFRVFRTPFSYIYLASKKDYGLKHKIKKQSHYVSVREQNRLFIKSIIYRYIHRVLLITK